MHNIQIFKNKLELTDDNLKLVSQLIKLLLESFTAIVMMVIFLYNTLGQFYIFSFLSYFGINAYELNLFNNVWFQGLDFIINFSLAMLILLIIQISYNFKGKEALKSLSILLVLITILIIFNNQMQFPSSIYDWILNFLAIMIILLLLKFTLKICLPNFYKNFFLKNQYSKNIMKKVWVIILLLLIIFITIFCLGRFNAIFKKQYFFTTQNEILLYKGKTGNILANGKLKESTFIIDKSKIRYTLDLDINGEYKMFKDIQIK